jgi:hypothetical protein
MNMRFISTLPSVNSVEKIQALNAIGIYSIRDMAEYAACRHAEFAMACFRQGNVENAGLETISKPPRSRKRTSPNWTSWKSST